MIGINLSKTVTFSRKGGEKFSGFAVELGESLELVDWFGNTGRGNKGDSPRERQEISSDRKVEKLQGMCK